MRHNTTRNSFGELLTETSKDVQLELQLAEVTGENLRHKTSNKQKDARIDISIGMYGGLVINPFLMFEHLTQIQNST